MGTPLQISQDLELDLERVIGQCIAVLGIRGSGKSNTVGVIFEELLRHNYPLSIVDIEGEYFGLKEKYEVLVVGTGDGVEIEIDAGCASQIAEVSMQKNVPVVLDLSGFLSDERTEILIEYLGSLWNLAGTLRRPYIIGIEEAHEFVPQGVKTELKEMIARIALRGRKRGLGAIIVSQRSAKVDKDVLTQAGMLFLHRVVHEVDMRVYSELLPWRKSEVKELIGGLDTGHCMFVDGDVARPIYVRERATFHAGFTPTLDSVATPELRQVSASIIEAIEKAREGGGKRTKTQELEEQVSRLQEKLAEREERIARLEETARTLGYIKVEVPRQMEPEPVQRASVEPEAFVPRLLGAHVRRTTEIETESQARQRVTSETGWGVLDVVPTAAPDAEDPEDELPPAVARHIERVMARIARASLLERRVLAFLVEHAPGSYTAEQVAAWTSCAHGLIQNELQGPLVEAGLIERERRSDGIRLRSRLKAFVAGEFAVYMPDIGSQGLHSVTRELRDRLRVVA
ncbi:MAG: DUF87 domain-containing protein [Candidatus Bipolaricaulota bacterium]